MADCEWCKDEICVNADCPMCCDYCPVPDVQGVCRFEDREGKEIESEPGIDAVPVVRCRDCKHHRDKNEQEQKYLVEDILICTSPDATDDCWNAVWPDHFCSYGERKEGAE